MPPKDLYGRLKHLIFGQTLYPIPGQVAYIVAKNKHMSFRDRLSSEGRRLTPLIATTALDEYEYVDWHLLATLQRQF